MGVIKSTAKGTAKTAKWAVPLTSDLDKQVDKALRRKEIGKAYEEYEGDKEEFVERLKKHIGYENQKNRRLRYFATALDTGNKALVPYDSMLDAFSILAGVGAGTKGLITLGKIPTYLAYDTYYLTHTGDVGGAIKNLGWESVAWFIPGSLPHLINRYTHQADDYAVKRGGENFIKSLKKGSLEDKVKQFPIEKSLRKTEKQDNEKRKAA